MIPVIREKKIGFGMLGSNARRFPLEIESRQQAVVNRVIDSE